MNRNANTVKVPAQVNATLAMLASVLDASGPASAQIDVRGLLRARGLSCKTALNVLRMLALNDVIKASKGVYRFHGRSRQRLQHFRETRECFYSAATLTTIDFVHPIRRVSSIYGNTLQEIRAKYPDARIGIFDQVYEMMSRQRFERHCKKVVEISEERWMDMLEILPPMAWVRENTTESFKMIERDFDNVTGCYVRIGSRFFNLAHRDKTPHAELVSLVLASAAYLNAEKVPGDLAVA